MNLNISSVINFSDVHEAMNHSGSLAKHTSTRPTVVHSSMNIRKLNAAVSVP